MYHNKHNVPFLLAVHKHHRTKVKSGRRSVKYNVILTCKRYPEAEDCNLDCTAADDPFCKCGWTASFIHPGQWGECETSVVKQAIFASQIFRRCKACSGLTKETKDELCRACSLAKLVPGVAEECPICQEVKNTITLVCGHFLCTTCARRLYFGETDAQCPCCRHPIPSSELASHLPPADVELPPGFL